MKLDVRLLKIVLFSSLALCLGLDWIAGFSTFGYPQLPGHEWSVGIALSHASSAATGDVQNFLFHGGISGDDAWKMEVFWDGFFILHDLAYVVFYVSVIGLVLKIGKREEAVTTNSIGTKL